MHMNSILKLFAHSTEPSIAQHTTVTTTQTHSFPECAIRFIRWVLWIYSILCHRFGSVLILNCMHCRGIIFHSVFLWFIEIFFSPFYAFPFVFVAESMKISWNKINISFFRAICMHLICLLDWKVEMDFNFSYIHYDDCDIVSLCLGTACFRQQKQ